MGLNFLHVYREIMQFPRVSRRNVNVPKKLDGILWNKVKDSLLILLCICIVMDEHKTGFAGPHKLSLGSQCL